MADPVSSTQATNKPASDPVDGVPRSATSPDDAGTRQADYFDANKKSIGVAYLLWFLAGFFGAHRFYLGERETGAGLLMLSLFSVLFSATPFVFLAFVPCVWWLVDAFLIPGIVRRKNVEFQTVLGVDGTEDGR